MTLLGYYATWAITNNTFEDVFDEKTLSVIEEQEIINQLVCLSTYGISSENLIASFTCSIFSALSMVILSFKDSFLIVIIV